MRLTLCRYIKELADRVTSLEGQLRQDAMNGTGPAMTPNDEAFLLNIRPDSAPPPANRLKRGRSEAEGTDDHYSNAQRSGFPPQPPSLEPSENVFQMDEQTISAYYQTVHPILPILPSDPHDLRQYVWEVPSATRASFLSAMSVALRGGSLAEIVELGAAVDGPSALLHHIASETEVRHPARIQGLIFLALGLSNHGSEVFRDGHINSVSPDNYILQAISVGEEMDIFNLSTILSVETGRELMVTRCLAISLGIMKTFNTFATKRVSSFRNSFTVPTVKKDKEIVGLRTFWIAGLFYISNPSCEVSNTLQNFAPSYAICLA
jgi:hypothetical protein